MDHFFETRFSEMKSDGVSDVGVKRAETFIHDGEKFLETYTITETFFEKSVQKARSFVEDELDVEDLDTKVFIVPEERRKDFLQQWRQLGFIAGDNDNGFYEPLVNSVVVYHQPERFHEVTFEATLVHELAHATSKKRLRLTESNNHTLVHTDRIGFALIASNFGYFLEEGLAGSLQAKYLQLNGSEDQEFWEDFMNSLRTVTKLVDEQRPFNTVLQIGDLKIPASYSIFDRNDTPPLLTTPYLLFGAAFDLLCQQIPSFRETAINARKDHKSISALAQMINNQFGKGSYVYLQKKGYYNGPTDALETYKYILERTK